MRDGAADRAISRLAQATGDSVHNSWVAPESGPTVLGRTGIQDATLRVGGDHPLQVGLPAYAGLVEDALKVRSSDRVCYAEPRSGFPERKAVEQMDEEPSFGRGEPEATGGRLCSRGKTGSSGQTGQPAGNYSISFKTGMRAAPGDATGSACQRAKNHRSKTSPSRAAEREGAIARRCKSAIDDRLSLRQPT